MHRNDVTVSLRKMLNKARRTKRSGLHKILTQILQSDSVVWAISPNKALRIAPPWLKKTKQHTGAKLSNFVTQRFRKTWKNACEAFLVYLYFFFESRSSRIRISTWWYMANLDFFRKKWVIDDAHRLWLNNFRVWTLFRNSFSRQY